MINLKNKFTFVFNDRGFDDCWAESYIVEITTKNPMKKEDLVKAIHEAIQKAEDSEDGAMLSEDGINQILGYLKDVVVEHKIYQHDYNFQFANLKKES